MPKYEVMLSAGPDFPVGMEFETDNLHPVMIQHVKQIGGKSAKAEVEDDKGDKKLTKAQLDKLHAEGLKEDAKRFPPEKVVKPANGPGPGENS
jgi:hypothetical protein